MTARQTDSEKPIQPEAKRSPRRWLQFSLRSLLLVFLLVAVFFGGRVSGRQWLRRERERTETERRNAAKAKDRADAEMARAELRLQKARDALRQAEVEYQQIQEEVLRHVAMLQAEIDRLNRERERNWRWMMPQDLVPAGTFTPARSSPAVDTLKPQAVPVNEYWQRPVRPARIRELPQAGVLPFRQRSAAI